jgi:hypothetical protein
VKAVFQIILAAAALAIFVWMLLGSKRGSNPADAVIDPNDSRQISTLIGMLGGDVKDAAVAHLALRRFEEEHGRKATVKDMAIVAGMMRTLKWLTVAFVCALS